MDYYLESPTLLIAYIAEPNAQLDPLLSSWPRWEGKLQRAVTAAAGLCHTTELDQGVVPCEVQVWWGEPSDYLDGAAVQTLAGVMGGVTLLPQSYLRQCEYGVVAGNGTKSSADTWDTSSAGGHLAPMSVFTFSARAEE